MKKFKKKIELENGKFPAYLQLKNLDCMKQMSIDFEVPQKKISERSEFIVELLKDPVV